MSYMEKYCAACFVAFEWRLQVHLIHTNRGLSGQSSTKSLSSHGSPASSSSSISSQAPSKRKNQVQRSSSFEVVLLRRFIVGPASRGSVSKFVPLPFLFRPAHQKLSASPLSSFIPPTRDRSTEVVRKSGTYICFPPKINRCCTGGMPSFSSTRSFMRETCSIAIGKPFLPRE